MLLPQQVIEKKRDGFALAADEIQWFVEGLKNGGIEDSQVAAFAMAVYFQGMTIDERVALTLHMRDSGEVLDWKREALAGPIVDKHSTGGVGDVVSLILGPLVAACGGFVPMISGRGLGHTGGTVDKLEAIPGYNSAPALEAFRQVVREAGVAIVGQTQEIAPADRRLYAIRDVTATVESIDLITASILSKKLAAGLDSLVMDVKIGNGAFMSSINRSEELAKSIVSVACQAGTPTSALLTDMNQCLASTAGNALETAEAMELLAGRVRSARLLEVTMALGAELLVNSGLADDEFAARSALENSLRSGEAAERFNRMSFALGGPCDIVERHREYFRTAPVVRAVLPRQEGIVGRIDVRRLGAVVVALGGGRTKTGQAIDHAVGLQDVASLGDDVSVERPLAVVHANSEKDFQEAATSVRAAFYLQDDRPQINPPVERVVRASDCK